MLYNERAELIMQQIQLQSTVKVNELSEQLQVSVDTIRRDLKAMEQDGLVKCVRGGACLPQSLGAFSNFKGREIVHGNLKREACRKALEYVKDGNLIALNSGTTNSILAQELVSRNREVTVVTNNLEAVNIMMQNPRLHVISIGGEVDALERSTHGSVCEQEFMRYFPDVSFLSVNAVNYKDGYTDFRMTELGIIRLLAKNSRQVIAVMDSTKLGKSSKCKALAQEEVDLLIMDDQVPEKIREKYRQKGIMIE